jgi:hypothetical protein
MLPSSYLFLTTQPGPGRLFGMMCNAPTLCAVHDWEAADQHSMMKTNSMVGCSFVEHVLSVARCLCAVSVSFKEHPGTSLRFSWRASAGFQHVHLAPGEEAAVRKGCVLPACSHNASWSAQQQRSS